jgi:hypothetical protein
LLFARIRTWALRLPILTACLVPAAAGAQQLPVVAGGMSTPGEKGAQIYCFMRDNGHSHEVSWDAAYEVIKRQGDGPFRTSPRHAAVMITETVVQAPGVFPNCGTHLGDLFRREETETAPQTAAGPLTRGERYGY